MTLIVGVASPTFVVLASDRRLTRRDGSVHDDEANKTICVCCRDSRFAIAYTGLGNIGGKRTDRWILDRLTSWNAEPLHAPTIASRLESALTTAFRGLSSDIRRTSVVMSGYRLGRPFTALISNFEDLTGVVTDDSLLEFRTYVRQMRQPSRIGSRRGLWIDLYGSLSRFKGPLGRRIRRLARKRFFHDAAAAEIARELVNTIRAASRDPDTKDTIGRSCMTVVVPRNGSEPMPTQYHPPGRSPVTYMPPVLINNSTVSMTFLNTEVWSEKPPWWKDRNEDDQ